MNGYGRAMLYPLAALVAIALCACRGTATRDDRAAAPVAAPAPTPASAPAPLAAGPRRIATGDGVTLHVDVAGNGPPCLYVHGGPGQGAQSFQRMRGDALQGIFTMIHVDQRGAGQSDNATDYRLDRVVDDLEDVRRTLGADRIYLLAHSFGGIIAFRYAEKYPDRVRGLILANATLHYPALLHNQIVYLREQLGDTERTPADASWDALNADYDRVRQKLRGKREYVPLLAEDVQTMRTLGQVDADPPRKRELGAYVTRDPRARADYDADFTLRTPAVRAPVLVITGDRDHAIGPDHHQRFRFPHQTVRHIDGSHLLYYENTDAFVAAIRTWLDAAPTR